MFISSKKKHQEEARKATLEEIAKKMIKKNYEYDEISDLTGISAEGLKTIREGIKEKGFKLVDYNAILKKRKRVVIYSFVVMAFSVFPLLFDILNRGDFIAGLISCAVLAAAFVTGMLHDRCPYCSTYNVNILYNEHCRHCGKRLNRFSNEQHGQ